MLYNQSSTFGVNNRSLIKCCVCLAIDREYDMCIFVRLKTVTTLIAKTQQHTYTTKFVCNKMYYYSKFLRAREL